MQQIVSLLSLALLTAIASGFPITATRVSSSTMPANVSAAYRTIISPQIDGSVIYYTYYLSADRTTLGIKSWQLNNLANGSWTYKTAISDVTITVLNTELIVSFKMPLNSTFYSLTLLKSDLS